MAARVAVVGSYGAGLTFRLDRVPERGETVMGSAFRVDAGGKGSNQAVGAARLGAAVDFLTAVGDDAFGADAHALWARERVAAAAIVVPDEATMVGAIFVEPGGENRIVVAAGALQALTPGHVDAFEPLIERADICITGLEIPVEVAHRALVLAREHGVRTVLDPAPAPQKPLPDDLLALADYLTPNWAEACALVGDERPAAELAERLRARSGSAIVLTLGGEGALVLNDGGLTAVPAVSVDGVVDTTGAGDAFNAAFAVALAEGAAELEAVRHGCLAGAWMVRVPGVVPGLPATTELESWRQHTIREVTS